MTIHSEPVEFRAMCATILDTCDLTGETLAYAQRWKDASDAEIAALHSCEADALCALYRNALALRCLRARAAGTSPYPMGWVYIRS